MSWLFYFHIVPLVSLLWNVNNYFSKLLIRIKSLRLYVKSVGNLDSIIMFQEIETIFN